MLTKLYISRTFVVDLLDLPHRVVFVCHDISRSAGFRLHPSLWGFWTMEHGVNDEERMRDSHAAYVRNARPVRLTGAFVRVQNIYTLLSA